MTVTRAPFRETVTWRLMGELEPWLVTMIRTWVGPAPLIMVNTRRSWSGVAETLNRASAGAVGECGAGVGGAVGVAMGLGLLGLAGVATPLGRPVRTSQVAVPSTATTAAAAVVRRSVALVGLW